MGHSSDESHLNRKGGRGAPGAESHPETGGKPTGGGGTTQRDRPEPAQRNLEDESEGFEAQRINPSHPRIPGP